MSEPDERDPDRPVGTLRPISAGALTVCAVLGLFAGWSAHPLGERITGHPPLLSWAQPLALVPVAGIMGYLAWHTWRTVQVLGRRLEVHHAVNRLVLARACALAGALVAGGYAGFAVSWLDDDSALADQWLLRSVVAALAALGIVLGSLALERACRTPGADAPP